MKYYLCITLAAVTLSSCSKGTQPLENPKDQPMLQEHKVEIIPKDVAKTQPERRNIVVLTDRAVAKARDFQEKNGERFLRVSISGPPDHFKYELDLDNKLDEAEDYLGESGGIQILVDRKSSLYMHEGIIVDWSDEPAGFKITLPDLIDIQPEKAIILKEARKTFKTTLIRKQSDGNPLPKPPHELFRIVRYDSPVGKLAAYLTHDPNDGKKHPAIVWITGGDCNTVGDGCWIEGPRSNDQSASAFRKAGIVMMFPSLRGGNDNPGVKEGFLGEVDDVVAAANYLGKQDFVDPDRIYLGGHSSGGTLVLLVAECTDRFRAVFSYGPTHDIRAYPLKYLPFAISDNQEVRFRSPGRWLHSISVPVFVFEGTGGALHSLQAMARVSTNPKVRFVHVKGGNHFNLLAPTNELVASRILSDVGPSCNLVFSEAEVSKPFTK